jgi:fumarate hydratase class I
VVEYPELGMEAIWRIEVQDFPAFTIIDAEGNDFYAGLIEKGRPASLALAAD